MTQLRIVREIREVDGRHIATDTLQYKNSPESEWKDVDIINTIGLYEN